MKHLSGEYDLIKSYYGSKKAKRSRVPLMNHIDEGIVMMQNMGASELAIRAFCLHPLAQGGVLGFNAIVRGLAAGHISTDSADLAIEYRCAADAYLCRPETDYFTNSEIHFVVGDLSQDLIHMLVADKIQNEKDFLIYHKGKHRRSDQLEAYFCKWLDYLDFCEERNKKEVI